ncbi:hypothetical protein D3C72_1640350 [compost metagenome]
MQLAVEHVRCGSTSCSAQAACKSPCRTRDHVRNDLGDLAAEFDRQICHRQSNLFLHKTACQIARNSAGNRPDNVPSR